MRLKPPFTPDPINSRLWVTLTASIAGSLGAVPLVSTLQVDGVGLVVSAVTTFVLMTGTLWFGIGSSQRFVGWWWVGLPFMGMLNAGLACGTAAWISSNFDFGDALGMFLLGSIIGAPIGLGYGSSYLVLLAPLLSLVGHIVRRPALDTGLRVVRACSGWFVFVAGVAALILAGDEAQLASIALGLAMAATLPCVATATLLWWRRRWVLRVARGADASWKLIEDDLPGTLPAWDASATDPDGSALAALARVEQPAADPYRLQHQHLRPAAWVRVAAK